MKSFQQKLLEEIEEIKDVDLQPLKTNICEVIFIKKNGELRTMHCTQSKKYIPTERIEAIKHSRVIKKPNYYIVYDMDKEDWRSFNKSQVQSCIKL